MISISLDVNQLPSSTVNKTLAHTTLAKEKYTTEESLLDGCRSGDRLAQKILYERYYGKMVSTAMRYATDMDEAIDIVNISFLKVFTSWDKYLAINKLEGWIARIVINSALDMIRKKNRDKKLIVQTQYAPEPSIQNEALDNLSAEEILNLLHQLTPVKRAVFTMYVIDGFRHKDIGQALDITEGTSKWILSEARKDLQALIIQMSTNVKMENTK